MKTKEMLPRVKRKKGKERDLRGGKKSYQMTGNPELGKIIGPERRAVTKKQRTKSLTTSR